MRDALLATTSTEGLQPLGTAAQRSFELVSGSLATRLGRQYGNLFGEPVANETGDRIDWYARVAGQATPLPELPAAEQAALRARLGALIGAVRDEAETLAGSDAPEDHRLSEALVNAVEVPDEAMIYGVRDADGAWHPVLVHWAWVRNEQAAVRGILTGMVPRPQGPVAPVTPVRTGPQVWWWWLIALGWILLGLLLGAILYLLVAPCGVNRFGLAFCPAEQAGFRDEFEEARILGDENARLLRELALLDRSCRAGIPVLPAPPDKPVLPLGPPALPNVPPLQQDEARTPTNHEEVETRITDRGAALGALNFVLEWGTKDDIDLYVTCPMGETISYSNRTACGGRYDLDANVAEISAIPDPVENIVFENAALGLYKVRVHLRDDRTGGAKTVTLHVLRTGGTSNSYTGTIEPGLGEWTANISISR